MDGIEYRSVHLVLDLHVFQGDEQLPVDVPYTAEQGRDAHEIDVFRQLLDPRIDGRLELVAVRAAVPEQLDHFDLPRLGHRHRAGQLDILLAGFDRLGLGRHTEQADGGESGTENQVTHALLLCD
ncbi:hypothetical protein D9M68_662600 [compost metagenome]